MGILLSAPVLLQAQNGNYILNGKIGTLDVSSKAYLVYRSGASSMIDSTLIKNGSFEFKGVVEDAVKARLVIERKGSGLKQAAYDDVMVIYHEPIAIQVTIKTGRAG